MDSTRRRILAAGVAAAAAAAVPRVLAQQGRQVSLFPWKEPKERIPLAVRQIHSFLRAHRSA
jgi:hypothetical protein